MTIRRVPKVKSLIEPSLSSLSRRSILKGAVATGIGAAMAPAYIKNARASSGELNLLCWSAELPADVMDGFTASTGIKVNKTPFSSNEEAINKMQATYGEGFDLVMPSFNRASEFRYIEVLQPFDEKRIDLSVYKPALLKASTDSWTWKKGLYHVPHVWGAEGMAWENSTGLTYAESSYGLVWDPKYAGKAFVRPTSGMLGLGLYLDAIGKVPSNRMLDCYKSQEHMRKVYDQLLKYAVAHKKNLKQFWDSADSIRAGFEENGCTIGQTWDGPIKSMIKDGKKVTFMAPKEGAITWMDGFAVSAQAKNIDQLYAFLSYLHKPKVAGQVCTGTGYNPTIDGVEPYLSKLDRDLFKMSYPKDALMKLWWYPASPEWFNPIRNEYGEKFKVA